MKNRAPRLRSTILATALAVGSLVPLAAPAAAAGGTITINVRDVDEDPVFGQGGDGLDGMTVRVHKVDGAGQPVAGAGVEATPVPFIPGTTPPGRYTATVPDNGSYKIEVFDPRQNDIDSEGATANNQDEYARVFSGDVFTFAQATSIAIADNNASTTVHMGPAGFINVKTAIEGTGEFVNGMCMSIYDTAGRLVNSTYRANPTSPSQTTNFVSVNVGTYFLEVAAAPLIAEDCSAGSQTGFNTEWYRNATSFSTSTGIGVLANTVTNVTDVELTRTNTSRTISGTVSANGGGALQAITVTLTPVNASGDVLSGGTVLTTTTNISGGWTKSVEPVRYKVQFTDQFPDDNIDYEPEWWNDKADFSVATIIDVTTASKSGINAGLNQAGTIAGTITKPDGSDADNNPDLAPGALVEFYRSATQVLAGSATTGADGTFIVRDLRPDTYRMKVTPAPADQSTLGAEWLQNKSDFESAQNITLASGQDLTGQNLELDAAASISGTVKDGAGAGIAGVCVAAYTPGGSFSRFAISKADDALTTTVNEAGTYEILGLTAGDYHLRASDGDDLHCGAASTPDYASQWYANRVSLEQSTAVRLGDSGTAGKDFTLVGAAGALGGKATRAANGANLANICIRVYNTSGQIIREALTASDGTWQVTGLAAQSVRVEYRPDLQSGDNCYATAADRLSTSTATPTDLGPTTPGGAGLANAYYLDKVTLADATPVPLTDVSPPVDRLDVNQKISAVTQAGSDTGNSTISGKVTKPDGNDSGTLPDPLQGACVIAVPSDWDGTNADVTASASTNASGVYNLTGLAEDKLFWVRASNDADLCNELANPGDRSGFNVTRWYFDKMTFATANGVRTPTTAGTTTADDIFLAYAGVISGLVTDTELGGGLSADVNVYRSSDGVLVRTRRTEANGTYVIGSLPPADYRVEFAPLDPNYRPEFFDNVDSLGAATTVVVGEKTTQNVSAELERNHAPIAADDQVTVELNSTTILDGLTSNDVDEDGDEVEITSVGDPANGSATLNEDGTVTYTAKTDSTETDTFAYTLTDNGGLTATATVTVTIVGEIVGAPPIAADDEATTGRNNAVTINVLANDSDPDGDDSALTIDFIGTPFHGTAVLSGNNIRYTPDTDFGGVDQFIYQIVDAQGFEDTGKVTVNVETSSQNAVNKTVAAGGTAATNGTTASPDNKVITSVTSPNAGTVRIEETEAARSTSNGLTIIEPRVDITAPNATASNPLTITFRLDGSVLQGLQPQRAILVLRNGTRIADCLGSTVASPDPCLSGHQRIGDDLLLTVKTSAASTWTFGFLDEAVVDRAATQGAGRVDTAVRIARQAFSPSEVDTVVIARSDTYPDALAGAPLAFQLGGPMLLTNKSALDVITRDEILRLGASRVVILGGPNAVSTTVENALRGISGVQTVDRIFGANRFETAAAIAQQLDPYTAAYVVEGSNADPSRGWPDAVSVAGLAAFQGRPVLLVTKDALPAETRSALSGLSSATVVGGPGAVSTAVLEQVRGVVGNANRIAGNSRYETNYLVALEARNAGMSPSSVWVATGTNFPDALAAGAAVAKEGGIMLLTHPTDYNANPRLNEWLSAFRNQTETVTITGGTGAVSAAVEAAIKRDVAT